MFLLVLALLAGLVLWIVVKLFGGKGTLALAGALLLADLVYVQPRYGGYLNYLLAGALSRKGANAVQGELGAVSSALSIYYGDHAGAYPTDFEAFAKDKRYLFHPVPHADQFVTPRPGETSQRPHWYKDTAKVKAFASVDDADDAGGWGYVNDPKSRDYGAFFVNCTHLDFRTGRPWHHIGPQTPQVWSPEPERSAAEIAASRARPEPPDPKKPQTVTGEVYESGRPARKLQDAEVAYTSVTGEVTRALTDAGGRYAVDLLPGAYRYKVRHSSHRTYDGGSRALVVAPQPNNGFSFGLDPR